MINLQTFEVQHISKHKRTLGQLLIFRFDDIREDDAVVSVEFPQLPCEAGAKLTQASSDEDARRFAGRGG